jgi:hypothetical protein
METFLRAHVPVHPDVEEPMSTLPHTPARLRRLGFTAALGLLSLTAPALPGRDRDKPAEGKRATGAGAAAVMVEVRLVDDSNLKLALRDERVELQTPYGKLLIPVADVRRVEFGLRIRPGTAKKIERAIADLGHEEFQRRRAASAELVALGAKAYPALLKAAKDKDPEVAKRAREVLEKLRAAVPEEQLESRTCDVVHTEDSRIAGRITAESLKVTTLAFGDQRLRLADVRHLRSLSAPAEPEAVAGLPDPGNLAAYHAQVGKTFAFKVTGAAGMAGGVWGTDVYTLDSSLALAAVHAGVVRAGETRVVRVTVLGPQAFFRGSVRHGVASAPYGPYPGYKVSK